MEGFPAISSSPGYYQCSKRKVVVFHCLCEGSEGYWRIGYTPLLWHLTWVCAFVGFRVWLCEGMEGLLLCRISVTSLSAQEPDWGANPPIKLTSSSTIEHTARHPRLLICKSFPAPTNAGKTDWGKMSVLQQGWERLYDDEWPYQWAPMEDGAW